MYGDSTLTNNCDDIRTIDGGRIRQNRSLSTNPIASLSHDEQLVEHLKNGTILETFCFIDKGFDIS